MMSPFVIPLAVFAMVVIIVAIVELVKVREKELDVHQRLHDAEMKHAREMQELEMELQRIKGQGA
jgi:cell division protein FtsL